MRVGEALGLHRSDLHFASSATALGCPVGGPHLHVVGRDNENGARAKSGERSVPVPAEVLACYDRYLHERDACPGAQGCDFVLVNCAHAPFGRPMTADAFRKWLAASSRRAGLSRAVTPHMFRHDGDRAPRPGRRARRREGAARPCLDPLDRALPAPWPGRPAPGGGAPWPPSVRQGAKVSARAAEAPRDLPPRVAGRLHDALDIALLAGVGWDPLSVTFAPDRHHRLLGYRLCRVAGCGLEAWSPSGLCGGCLARFETEGKGAGLDAFCEKGCGRKNRSRDGSAWSAASPVSSAR
jgi:Phage integrase family